MYQLAQTKAILQTADTVKYHGVALTNTSDWLIHIDAITSKAYHLLYFFESNFKDAPKTLKGALYFTNKKPVLQYACTASDPSTEIMQEKLERVRKRAA